MKCSEFIKRLEKFAPVELAETWDNPGLIVGDTKQEIKKALVALDATLEVIDEAISLGADIIVTHHPMLFGAVKKITDETPAGIKIMKLIKNNISHYAMHTNLDIAFGGTNDRLAEIIGLKDIEILRASCEQDGKENGLGRIGILENETGFFEFSQMVKTALGLDSMRVVGNLERTVKKIALCTGSGFEFMEDAVKKGADVYITADLRYHESQKAIEKGICLIDATHYASENIIVPVISGYIQRICLNEGVKMEVFNSEVNGQVFKEI